MKKPDDRFVIPSDIFNELYEAATSFTGKISALNEAMGATEGSDNNIVLVGVVEDIVGIFTLKLDQIWERAVAERKEATP